MLPPCLSFPNQDEYVWRHEQGTLIEMDNEEKAMKRLNNKRLPFYAWPVAPIPGLTTAFSKSWLFLVKVPTGEAAEAFPSLADRFTIDLDSTVHRPEGTFSLVRLPASRIANPYENMVDAVDVQKCAAFKVDVPRSWKAGEVNIEIDLMATFQTASSIDNISISLDPNMQQTIFVQFDTSCLTFEAELAALHHLAVEHRLQEMAPSKVSLDAFKMLQNFDSPISYRNLHDDFPQLKNPRLREHRVPKLILDKFKAFNADHKAALKGLQSIPNSVYFVNGCPGAGKTEWNMVLSALIHSRRSPKSRRRHTPILFLVDINKTVDDAANRYYRLCQDAGLKRLRIIRMHSWPYEIRNSAKLNKGAEPDETDAEPDFTRKFLTTASLARHADVKRDPRQAPTLDEASWEYYERHKGDCFQALCKLLTRMESGEVMDSESWKALRRLVSLLYRAVLAQTDFVATTPVATFGHFSKLFRPDLVVMDEAPHARELTSLIPIAFFSPLAWIFTGDVNQTRPFVKNDDKRSAEKAGLQFNPFAEQLRTSTMARAAAVGAINSKLLMNKRSFANLHRLPSRLFYDGQMSSGYDEATLYPPSTLYLKGYLEKLGGVKDMGENRLVVRLQGEEQKLRESFWNPVHHEWVLAQVQLLLQDESFTGSGKGKVGKGKVMIAAPYRTAVRQYHSRVKTWPEEWQDRVEVLTVDKAQGNEADFVFLDLVRTERPGFMDDPKRLNVAISRARQAEVIVMHPRMTFRRVTGGKGIRNQYLSQIWDDAVAQGRLTML
ncbi:hypothetical protein CP533_6825 [Ophiocordyceps camponoti-saundersi (nom. inval.)]|nr:hypothetical protein CP533_6825 [Ophiocordyceps camponoti-saundersi (nom. inval.)]